VDIWHLMDPLKALYKGSMSPLYRGDIEGAVGIIRMSSENKVSAPQMVPNGTIFLTVYNISVILHREKLIL